MKTVKLEKVEDESVIETHLKRKVEDIKRDTLGDPFAAKLLEDPAVLEVLRRGIREQLAHGAFEVGEGPSILGVDPSKPAPGSEAAKKAARELAKRSMAGV